VAVSKDEEYWFEDECCMNCGELNYQPSRVPGLCKDCLAEPDRELRT